LSVIALSRQI